MSQYETILVEKKGAVTLVTLNRPQALNALNSTVLKELIEAFQTYDADPEQRCLVRRPFRLAHPARHPRPTGRPPTASAARSPMRTRTTRACTNIRRGSNSSITTMRLCSALTSISRARWEPLSRWASAPG